MTSSFNENKATQTVDKETVFLGIGLDEAEIRIALNVQFALLIVLFLFSLLMTCIALMALSKLKITSALSVNREGFAKL